MKKHIVNHGDKTIEFELERKNVKNINLRVKPDLRVLVSANERVPFYYIENYIKDKTPWILEKIQHFEKTRNTNAIREFVSGETVRYLGKQYRLRIEQADKEEAKFFQGYVYLYVKDKNDYNRKKRLFDRWVKQKAGHIFNESLERMYPKIKKYGIAKPVIVIRSMKTRWGSCSREKKKITLNSELIKAPKYCIDYIVLHELIHFRYRNHNQEFYNFLTALMPDWKQRKSLLDSEVVLDV